MNIAGLDMFDQEDLGDMWEFSEVRAKRDWGVLQTIEI